MRRRVDPFDKRSMTLSAALHGAVIAFFWLSTQYAPPEMEFVTYQVELVSPPPAEHAEVAREATEELVVERPDPEPAPPEPEPEEVVPVEQPVPERKPDPPPPVRRQPDPPPPKPEEKPVVAAAPVEAPEPARESGEGLNVRMEGLRRDYPEYYNNIILQIRRCFRWRDGGRWQTTIVFWITRDGTATDMRFERRSGNTAFDFDAAGAIDCAGKGKFGPLPADLPFDRFPIRFEFSPSGDFVTFFPEAGTPARVTRDR